MVEVVLRIATVQLLVRVLMEVVLLMRERLRRKPHRHKLPHKLHRYGREATREAAVPST